MQQGAGVAERMDVVGRRVIRSYLIEQHRLFYAQLPFVILGTVDSSGDVWATVRAGLPGFLYSWDPSCLKVSIERDETDPADIGMADGDAVAVLGIELHTRRRNRMNGTIVRHKNTEFDILVKESFGNCPRYIHLKNLKFSRDPKSVVDSQAIEFQTMTEAPAEIVRNADTFFVASYIKDDSGCRVDVSHRGGPPGFVRLEADGSLTIPDYAGNFFFNTLGNFLINPRAGIVFIDFERGGLLQMTGQTEIITKSSEVASFAGAERLWRFLPKRIVSRSRALPLRMALS